MAAIGMKGKVTDVPDKFTKLNLVGTETVTATVGAGEVAIIIDSGVRKESIEIDTLTRELASRLRELGYK